MATTGATDELEFKDGLCGICPAGCWVRVGMRDGKMERVEPRTDHPMGMICTIGKHSPDVVYDPDRLQYPLRRVGPKGTHEFERITWEEAFTEIVDRLQSIKAEHGPEATAIYTGRGSFDMAMCDVFQPADVAVSSASSVLFPFGSPNTLGVGALCYVSFAMIAPHVTMGEMLVSMDTDLEQSELIVVWGANPATDSPPLAYNQIIRAKNRGAEVVSIDPRRNGTAKRVDAEWVPVRPGTDGALALSMIQVLIEEELYDEDFATNWAVGFDDLANLTQHYRPEVAEGITGVPADSIRSLARRIASARGACPVMYTGLEYSDSGVQAIRAVLTLWALAGQLDVPGGWLVRMRENSFPQNREKLVANPDVRKALGRDRFPVYSAFRGESHAIALPDSVLRGEPYKVRALIVLGGSIITSWPNPSVWRETMNALDFSVSINRYHTADSAYADIVLPATTQYETTSFMRYGPLFKIREKVIEPVGEARNDFFIMAELADRLGYGHLYPQTEDELLRHALEGTGFTLEQVRENGGEAQMPTVMMQYKKWEKGKLRSDGKPGFNTPSGKFEIAASTLVEHGYDALPVYTEPGEGPLARPDLAATFPLVFNSGARTRFDFRSQHHGVAGLREKAPEPNVIMNTADAAERTIADGDPVWVATPRGRLRYRARVTDDIVAGAIDAQMGGGGPLGSKAWQQCNVNDLTDLDRHDPISGFPVYKTLLCEITRADGESVAQSDDDDDTAHAPIVAAAPTRKVYLDNNATTRVDPAVLEAMLPFLSEEHGNPSSIHGHGTAARSAVEGARRKVAQVLNCTARRVVFTSSGSEANNLAIKGVALAAGNQRKHIVTSAVEHPAVLNTCRALEHHGFDLSILPVDEAGRVSPDALRAAIRPDTALVSIMLANNEVGTIQPIAELAAIAHDDGALFHTDAVQGLGKIAIDVAELGIDLLSMSAHKVHGPKGVGALYVKKGVELSPLIHGGGQERSLRSGTENVPGVVGFGKACELAERRLIGGEMNRLQAQRDRLHERLLELVPEAILNGDVAHRLPNTLNVTLPTIRGESLVLFLDRRGVYLSSGSACKAGKPDPSHALLAMGMSEESAHCAVRFSLSLDVTDDDLDYVIDAVGSVIEETMTAIRFVSCR
jgi:cysteine desulfurase NifS